MNYKNITKKQLIEKINNLKDESKRTLDCLAKLEAELEKRKQKAPLGVPCDGKFYVAWNGVAIETQQEEEVSKAYFNSFNSKESAEKHAEMLLAWRKALVANAKGEQIDVEVLSPLLPKGKVFFSTNLHLWVWTKEEPKKGKIGWICRYSTPLSPFNIKPAEDWRESLMECGL